MTILVSKNNNKMSAQLVVAVIGAIENKMINAGEMAKGLREKGHIALYGIYFDTDKAVIKPESSTDPGRDCQALARAAATQCGLSLATRTARARFDHNTDLSRRRADCGGSAELVSSYQIAASRLKTAGVGFLAPIGSNATDAGRALNRRVELVAP